MRTADAFAQYWDAAAATDQSLRGWRRCRSQLEPIELRSQPYSRTKLFSAIVRQEPIILDDFPVRAQLEKFFDHGHDTADRLRRLFRKSTATTLTRLGPAKRVRYLPISEVIDRWEKSRGLISANDIFYRTEGFDRVFDCSAIASFNILPTSPPRIKYLEVATMLMGTKGCMTDSHSDDPDGCNYCILGRKFWLVWDRKEGQANGLADCEHEYVSDKAQFDLRRFARLSSARWFTLSQGQTLFLPGNHTHKVITIERYLGISSFYVGLPNALSSLSRWELNKTIMVTPPLRNQIITLLTRQLDEVANGTDEQKLTWGFDYLAPSLRHWKRHHPLAVRSELLSNPRFHNLVTRIETYCQH